jgi:CHAT domain-containing protein/tetratricopeptide (TPR) repeat protein
MISHFNPGKKPVRSGTLGRRLAIRAAAILPLALAASLSAESGAPTASDLAMAGRYADAAGIFIRDAESAKSSEARVKATMNAAACLKMNGDIVKAADLLSAIVADVDALENTRAQSLFLSEYGSVLALGRRPREAAAILTQAMRLAESLDDAPLLGEIHNDLSIAMASAGMLPDAHRHAQSAFQIATRSDMPDLACRARQNRLYAAFAIWNKAAQRLRQDLDHRPTSANDSDLRAARSLFLDALAATPESGGNLASQPLHLQELAGAGAAAVRFGEEARGFALLEAALRGARDAGHLETERAALLTLAELYLDHARLEDANTLLAQVRRTQPWKNPVQHAMLEVLAARAAAAGSDTAAARELAERAARLVDAVRSDLAGSQAVSDLGRGFRDAAGVPYLILADLAAREGSPESLRRARDTFEAFKAWELDDFFRDDCVNLALEQAADLSESIDPGVCVLYILPLTDRTVILVGTAAGLKSWTAPTPGDELLAKARLLRHRLETERGFPSFIEPASDLHAILIQPCLSHLQQQGVKHLVVIPDGPLAALPFGVLRDARNGRFLIEEMSISVAPGMSLLGGSSEANTEPKVLLAGVSEAAGGFAALPAVRAELDAVARVHTGATRLLDGDFTATAFAESVTQAQATVVHIASHAVFSGSSDDTFLLTHSGRITMDDLEKIIRPRKFTGLPVDLLCLSACQTAEGDDRAALGLAGVALKSGARTVVASLWRVDDAASSRIMAAFHRHWRSGGIGKAEALRMAQLEMLRDDPYVHPYLWAPFIVIGDWK